MAHFATIKARLETYLQDTPHLSIEHVGSTSVPGLAAKPIIDITIICHRADVSSAIAALVANNFTYMGELGVTDRHALRDPDQVPARNVYVSVDGAFQTRNHIAVRDTLRADPGLRDEYAGVKLGLAARGMDIVEYVEAKTDIIQKILAKAGLLSEEEREAISHANRKHERFAAIKTERLVLREFVMGDVEALYGLESRGEVVRYQNYGPKTRKEAEGDVVAIIRGSSEVPRRHFELAVTHKGVFVGRVGAMVRGVGVGKSEGGHGVKDADAEGVVLHADLWFSFLPEAQGKGFATEAMRTFIPLLGSSKTLEIECDPRNTGSRKLAERLGFERISLTEKVAESKGEWVDSLVYQKRV